MKKTFKNIKISHKDRVKTEVNMMDELLCAMGNNIRKSWDDLIRMSSFKEWLNKQRSLVLEEINDE